MEFLRQVIDCLVFGNGETIQAIPWFVPMLVGAAAGMAKHKLIDQPAAKKHAELQAVKAKYSPWTRSKAQPLKTPSMFGSMLQGGGTGLMMGQSKLGGKFGVDKFMQGATQGASGGANLAGVTLPNPGSAWTGMQQPSFSVPQNLTSMYGRRGP